MPLVIWACARGREQDVQCLELECLLGWLVQYSKEYKLSTEAPFTRRRCGKRYGKFADSIRYDRLRTKRYARVYTKTMQGRSKMPSLGPTTKSSIFCRASTTTKRHQAWTGTLCASKTSWFDRCFQMYRRTCTTLLLIPLSSVENF